MTATASATASATGSAAPADWLTVDTRAQIGPADYGQPAQGPAVPAVPTADNPFAPGSPVTAPAAGGTVADGGGAGAWPALPPSGDGRAPLDRGDGFPQGRYETQAPRTDAPGMWASAQDLQTYDAISQHTDNAGWSVNVPNDRISERRTFGQANPLNNPTWYGYGENPARARLAVRPAPLTADPAAPGTPGFANGGLPDWSATGGQGATAYDTPAPPPSAAAPAVSVPDPAGRWA